MGSLASSTRRADEAHGPWQPTRQGARKGPEKGRRAKQGQEIRRRREIVPLKDGGRRQHYAPETGSGGGEKGSRGSSSRKGLNLPPWLPLSLPPPAYRISFLLSLIHIPFGHNRRPCSPQWVLPEISAI